MAPVHAEGKKIIENATGKVVAHGKTKKSAKIAARIRNEKHREKMEGK
jgi:hypothetical protein